MRQPVRILSLSILAVLAVGVVDAKKPPPASASPQAGAAPASGGGTTSASVYKDGVVVRQTASTTATTVGTLSKGNTVEVEKQEGLWFNVKAQPGTGYVKINEVRLAQAPGGDTNDGYKMFGGSVKPGETAGVRGLDSAQLRGATFDGAAVARMEALRVDDNAANSYASRMHLQKTEVAYKKEPGIGEGHRATSDSGQQAEQQQSSAVKKGLFGMVGGKLGGVGGSVANHAADAMPKSEQEKYDSEIAMGPQIAGRVLSLMPIWQNPQAQRRVNTIGRWVALQTPRDDLPWTFVVVDSPTLNAFSAPGGYILVTSALYQELQSDDELAAVLGHEISHVVARDQYNVIAKQAWASIGMDIAREQAVSHVGSGAAKPLEQHLANYFLKEGAAIVLTGFDKDVEYRADVASLIYTARAGYNPLAMYAVLQKLEASATPGRTGNLFSTHPTPDKRLDNLDKKGIDAVAQYTDRPYVAAR